MMKTWFVVFVEITLFCKFSEANESTQNESIQKCVDAELEGKTHACELVKYQMDKGSLPTCEQLTECTRTTMTCIEAAGLEFNVSNCNEKYHENLHGTSLATCNACGQAKHCKTNRLVECAKSQCQASLENNQAVSCEEANTCVTNMKNCVDELDCTATQEQCNTIVKEITQNSSCICNNFAGKNTAPRDTASILKATLLTVALFALNLGFKF